MTFQFKPAIRTETSLLIAIAGCSGSGKTFSALRLATGLAGDGRIAAIDTEAGRMLHYADQFQFAHGELTPPFTPEAYMEAIVAAEQAGFRVIVIDSYSHLWDGEGGLQDIQSAELERMCTDDRTGQVDKRKLERLTAPAWKLPKLRNKKLVNRLLQCRAHLIFCLRAEEKIRFEKVKDERGYERTAIVPAGWMPICEKRFPYEMTVSMVMLPDHPGVPVPVKIQEQHRFAFPEGSRVDEAAGRQLAAWARGGKSRRPDVPASPGTAAEGGGAQPSPGPAADHFPGMTADQNRLIEEAWRKAEQGYPALKAWFAGLSDADAAVVKPFMAGPKKRAQEMDALAGAETK